MQHLKPRQWNKMGGRLMTQIVEVIINWPNLTEQYSLNLHGFWQKRVADLRVET